MFGLTRRRRPRASLSAPLDLDEAIAIDDRAHGRDQRGWTPAERERANLYAQCVNAGVDLERVQFVAWLVGRGDIHDE